VVNGVNTVDEQKKKSEVTIAHKIMKLLDNCTQIKERMNVASDGSSRPPALPPSLYYAPPFLRKMKLCVPNYYSLLQSLLPLTVILYEMSGGGGHMPVLTKPWLHSRERTVLSSVLVSFFAGK
jgi:hypothetical protein